jgi:hypothetical protein
LIARSWSFLCGVPLGVLGTVSLVREPGLAQLAAGGLAGATVLLVAALGAARRGDDAPDRSLHVAGAASAAWLSVPAVAASVLDLGPPAWGWLVGVTGWLAARLWRAGRVSGDAGSTRGLVLRSLAALALGTLLVPALSALWAAFPRPGTPLDPDVRAAAYHIDSGVALTPRRSCALRVARSTRLVSGASPRLAADPTILWYEATGPQGRRQVHRLDRSSGAIRCLTCGQPGNNRRPAPHPTGDAVLFDTDRYATRWRPRDTDVMVGIATDGGPERSPRRLTHEPGADDHPLYDPSGQGFVASVSRGGRYRVERRAIRSGHGGLVLAGAQELFRGGASWSAALAWSGDARSLVLVAGNPLRSWRAGPGGWIRRRT